ncbi:hypothetical protein [Staphylococcus saprophyticus]|uniref:hypothetical protein n=1 Tax=Staphylococcus saprophyticus TaxID=29385 RepID=UPI00119DDAB5|nr:hypothetical protein [Staphylococcus saprophyticus]
MLEDLGWEEGGDKISGCMEKTIACKVVSYEFGGLMDGGKEVCRCEFGDELIKNV